MEEKKSKCPLCNKRLVMKDGVPTCPDCGYRDPYRSGSGQLQPNYSQPAQPSYSSQQSQPSYGGQQPQQNYSRPAGTSSPAQQKDNSAKGVIIAVVVAAAILVVVGVIYGLYAVVNNAFMEFADSYMDEAYQDSYGSTNSHRESGSSTPSADTVEATNEREVSDVSHLTFTTPESTLLQEFVSQLFGKSAASLTREELGSIVRVELREPLNGGGKEIDYELADGTTGTCYLTWTRVETADFKCFHNLETLNLGHTSLDWDTDWHNLKSLSSVSCQASLNDLAKCMDVTQLTSLELIHDAIMNNLSGIEEYSNLEHLSLDFNDRVFNLTGISQAPALRELVIVDGDGISDFEELYTMPQLTLLSIESKGLRDIGFVSVMPELESLELRNTQLKRIDAIADCAGTLKSLRLHQNYSVEDYSAVLLCTGLEELELYVYYDVYGEMIMPDLSNMSELKILTLGNFDIFPSLQELSTLESLTLVDGGVGRDPERLAGLEALTNLKSLTFLDMSVNPEFLEPIGLVPSLEILDLEDTFIWGNINVAFTLPNLRVLNLQDADFGLYLEEMPVSESLQELNLTGAHAHTLAEDGTWDYAADNTRIYLSERMEIFEHMPNLTVLHIPSQELQDVKFAEKLTQLIYLDITNNYVTDLTPLAGLEHLRVVACDYNPIHERTGLDNVKLIE